jgi:hypothetical protein
VNETVRARAAKQVPQVERGDAIMGTLHSSDFAYGCYVVDSGIKAMGGPIAEVGAFLFHAAIESYREGAGFANSGSVCGSTSPSLLGANTLMNYLGVPVIASGQVPIIVQPPQRISDEHSIPYLCFNVPLGKKKDEIGVFLPSMHEDVPRIVTKSLGDIVEPFTRYLREFNLVMKRLHERRGTSAQEHFMFDVVAPFIEKYGTQALQDIDLTLDALPRSARYGFPYLLGHIRPADIKVKTARVDYLMKYAASTDDDIREGAADALEHLNAA